MKNPLRSGARKLNCFVDDLTGSRFYLLRGITLRAGRGVRLLSTVIHFFLQISVPSGAARRRLPDVFRVCPFFGLVVLECLE